MTITSQCLQSTHQYDITYSEEAVRLVTQHINGKKQTTNTTTHGSSQTHLSNPVSKRRQIYPSTKTVRLLLCLHWGGRNYSFKKKKWNKVQPNNQTKQNNKFSSHVLNQRLHLWFIIIGYESCHTYIMDGWFDSVGGWGCGGWVGGRRKPDLHNNRNLKSYTVSINCASATGRPQEEGGRGPVDDSGRSMSPVLAFGPLSNTLFTVVRRWL